jgi:hypothetical protein
MIKASATAAAKNCDSEDDDVKCSLNWRSTTDDKVDGLGEVHNALQAVSGMLWPQAKALQAQNSSAPGSSSATPTGNGTSQAAETGAPGAAANLVASPVLLLITVGVAMLWL